MNIIVDENDLKNLVEAFLKTYHVTTTNQAFLDNVLWDLKDHFLVVNTLVLDYFTDEELEDIIKIHFGIDPFDAKDYFN